MNEEYTWTAHYRDGGSVAERDPAGDHGWAEVDQARGVLAIELRPATAGQTLIFSVAEGAAAVFARRRETPILGAEAGAKRTTTIAGWRREGGDGCYLFLCGGVAHVNTDFQFTFPG